MKKNNFKPFTISLVGSMPRSERIKSARSDFSEGKMSKEDYDKIVYEETEKIVRLQEENGVDVICSGEITRDNYISFIADYVDGITSMKNTDIINYVSEEQRESLEESLIKRNTETANLSNPICNGRIDTSATFEYPTMKLLKELTDKPVKATLPSPYLLTRTTWLTSVTDKYYPSREALGNDIVKLLLNEVDRLIELGVEVIQLDDPILSEIVLADDDEESFFCGRLSEKIRYDHELLFAMKLIQPVLRRISDSNSLSCLHVCRGNYTKKEDSLLSGSYASLSDFFSIVQPDMLTLEFSTPRAGSLKDLYINEFLATQSILGLGVVNPKTEYAESPEFIIDKVKQALEILDPDKIWINPDCGFATFEQRPMNSEQIIVQKLKNMKEAQTILREQYCN